MSSKKESFIYLLDYLANHTDYIEEVTQLKINYWLPTSPDRPYDVWLSEIRESAQTTDKPPVTFVALPTDDTGDHDLAGFVTIIPIDEKYGIEHGLWMITLYVKAQYRNQGIGTHLMQRCITEGKRLAYPALHLWTESKELTSFYNKRGWQVLFKYEESGDDVMITTW